MIETHCTSCGADFTPAPDALRRGPGCAFTRCRGDPGDEVPAVVLDDSRRRRRDPRASLLSR